MQKLRQWQVFCPILAIAALATFPRVVSATSCMGDRSTLAERYATANAIVVAQANSCTGSALADGSSCPGDEYQFSILEVLKDTAPSRDLSGTFKGDGFMGCGLVFRLGQSYLLYLDDEGQPLHRFYGYLDDEYPRSETVKESVRILREYRDNVVHDLSGPWTFYDSGLSCELRHMFDGASISIVFDYRPQQFWDATLHGVDGTGPHGEALFRLENSNDMRSRGEISITFDYEGPEVERENIYARVVVENRKNAFDGFLTVSAGTQSWGLHPMTVTTSGSIVSTSRFVSDMLVGNAALEFVRELRSSPKELSVITNQGADGAKLDYPKSIRTRSTQFARTIGSFDRCVNDDERRGAIITQ